MTISAEHNHPKEDKLRMGEEQSSIIETLTSKGATPRLISHVVNSNPELPRTSDEQIYRFRQEIRASELNGERPIDVLWDSLRREGYTFDVAVNDMNQVSRFFFAHPNSIILFKSYPMVVLMDCTYRTNCYKMKFLDVVGVTGYNGININL